MLTKAAAAIPSPSFVAHDVRMLSRLFEEGAVLDRILARARTAENLRKKEQGEGEWTPPEFKDPPVAAGPEKLGQMLKEAQWAWLGKLLSGLGRVTGRVAPRAGAAMARGGARLVQSSPLTQVMAQRQAAQIAARALPTQAATAAREAAMGLRPGALHGALPVQSVAQGNAMNFMAANAPLSQHARQFARMDVTPHMRMLPPPPVPRAGSIPAPPGVGPVPPPLPGRPVAPSAQPVAPATAAATTPVPPGSAITQPGVMDVARNYLKPETWQKAWGSSGARLSTALAMGMGLMSGQSMPAAAIGALAPMPFFAAKGGFLPGMGVSLLAGNVADRMFPGAPPPPPAPVPAQEMQAPQQAGYYQ